LFAGVADREMPCRVAGCENTWLWFGHQQIRSLGKPAPKRMCDDHLAEFEGIEDKQMPCRNSWCTNTWFWPRFAQLRALEHEGKVKPPHRLCETCFNEDRTTEDLGVRCKIPECRNTWTWPRQAQIKHRAWVRRQLAIEDAEERGDAAPMHVEARDHGRHDEAREEAHDEAREEAHDEAHDEGAAEAHEEPHDEAHAEAEAPSDDAASEEASSEAPTHEQHADGDEGQHKRRRRKRKRRRKIHEGPPERLCDRCNERINHLQPMEIPCKVHGCHSTWTWDREGQLRAWATLDGQTHVTELPQPPRRMCMSCLEFVRKHSDREVRCGRPGCEKVWMYKTGAQLQDYLAGRTQDPIRLCEECIRSQFTISTSSDGAVPPGSEIMPCMVSGCSGTWVYVPGMKLPAADPDASEPPVDRMCDDCRSQRDVPARDPRRSRSEAEPASEVEAVIDEAIDPSPPEADIEPDADASETVEPAESETPIAEPD
jgi:hypothetical protein